MTEIVVSPGSRSQALALAAAALERAGGVRVHVRLDERTAAFFALGLAVESGRPALVVTTSGTAVANLHPAVLEAHHSGVPMILLTADRPAELRGIGSNQTTVQPGIFGSAVRMLRDVEAPRASGVDESVHDTLGGLARQAVAAAAGHAGPPGPAHVNVAFREPLSAALPSVAAVPDHEIDRAFAARQVSPGAAGVVDDDIADTSAVPLRGQATATIAVDDEPGTVVIAGHDASALAEDVAWRLGAPLIAEVTSGAHFGRHLVTAYRPLLRDAAYGGTIRRAIVFGHPTLSREVPALLQRLGASVVVVRGGAPEAYDPARSRTPDVGATVVDAIAIEGTTTAAHRQWVGRWVLASRALLGDGDAAPDLDAKRSPEAAERNRFLRDELSLRRRPVTRELLMEAVWGATWPHDRLVLGASQLIRVADAIVPGKKIRVHANRGLAGIDGTISTALGISAATELRGDAAAAGITRVLVGDLTFLHDVGALATGEHEVPHRLHVIVGNDHGGAIFRGLEVAATAPAADMDRMMLTPQRLDIAAIATGFGWEHRRVATWGDLLRVLTDPAPRLVIEVPLADADASERDS